jgi:hypothetical protein
MHNSFYFSGKKKPVGGVSLFGDDVLPKKPTSEVHVLCIQFFIVILVLYLKLQALLARIPVLMVFLYICIVYQLIIPITNIHVQVQTSLCQFASCKLSRSDYIGNGTFL